MPPDAIDADLPTRLARAIGDRFRLGDPIGRGGFATVFRAHDVTLGRDVAIKAIETRGLDDADADAALAEARTVARAEHPHIVPLYEAGRGEGLAWLAMRYYADGTLAGRLARGPLPPDRVARLGVEVASALAAAHDRGVVHLDVKPDNVLLDGDGHAAVTDFGIARATGRAAGAMGESYGTPRYMSPEQVAGEAVDARSDVYALGVVLYEAASGRLPFEASGDLAVMARHLREPPPPITDVAPALPAALGAVIMRALAKAPADRFPSARAMADALRAAGERDALLSPAESRARTRKRWYRRAGVLVAGGALGIVVVIAVVVGTVRRVLQSPPPALDIFAPYIPAPMLDSARALAAIGPADTALYAFIPAGAGTRDALFVTTREIVALTDGAVRRWPRGRDSDIDLNLSSAGGFLVIDGDTVYRRLGGRELRTLLFSFERILPPGTAGTDGPAVPTPAP